jgi:hypothetical protein
MSDSELSFLNVYEVEVDGQSRHLVGFLQPEIAAARGIDSRAMVGAFEPAPDGEFDVATFEANPEFVEAFTEYMNGAPSYSRTISDEARLVPGERLFLVDPRNDTPADQEPPIPDVLGSYLVDDSGRIVPNSFQYNPNHVWFSIESGVSGVFSDRDFYNWLHAGEEEPLEET